MRSNSKQRYVVAVSGGVDSVVLLDALAHKRRIGRVDPWEGRGAGEIIVAHFDHGIRYDSAEDEAFVRKLAAHYKCDYRTARVELGENASEERARVARYEFLQGVCRDAQATLVTAHHCNDVAETIAINVTRGTGWRGVAVMDTEKVWRPLLGVMKEEIITYAKTHELAWREDSTNASQKYLRNRIRSKLTDQDTVMQLATLRAEQVRLKREIDHETRQLIGNAPYSRYFFTHCSEAVAIELLRAVCMNKYGNSPTREQRRRMLHAVKIAGAGSSFSIAKQATLRFTRTHFVVE